MFESEAGDYTSAVEDVERRLAPCHRHRRLHDHQASTRGHCQEDMNADHSSDREDDRRQDPTAS